jgi:hypothetical protein
MEAQTIVGLLGGFLLAVGAILWRLPVGTCAECPHCHRERLEREIEQQREADRDLDARYGLSRCPRCGRVHRADREC